MNTEGIQLTTADAEGDGAGPEMVTGTEQAVPIIPVAENAAEQLPAIPQIEEIASSTSVAEELATQGKQIDHEALRAAKESFSEENMRPHPHDQRYREEVARAREDLGLNATDARLQKLIDILKAQGGIIHEEI